MDQKAIANGGRVFVLWCFLMGNLIDTCNFFVDRTSDESWIATSASYFTLIALNVLCAGAAISQILLLPAKPSWLRHGIFLKLVLVGCFVGVAASYFRMLQVYYGTAAPKSLSTHDYYNSFKLDAQSDWNGALFYLLTPWETTCLLFAKLLVLERMGTFAIRFRLNPASFVSKLIEADSRRIFLGVIFAFLLTGIFAYSFGAAFYFRSSSLKYDALRLNTSDALVRASVFVDVSNIYRQSSSCLSVHDFSESAMFLIIIVSFCFIGIQIRRRIQSLLGKLPDVTYKSAQCALEQGASLSKRITFAVATIFFSFFLRFIWTLVNATAGLSPRNKTCAVECDACQSPGYLISKILFEGGELRAFLFMLSNPLALLVSVIVMRPQKYRTEDTNNPAAALINRAYQSERAPRGTFDGRVAFGSAECSPPT
jgi:hypothetical protein